MVKGAYYLMMSGNLDNIYRRQGHRLIAGVDEVGRGSWAGPLVAAAVIMPAGRRVPHVTDSKLMSEQQRAAAFPKLVKQALACSVACITQLEIDQFGLHRANLFALSYCLTHLPLTPDLALIDGFAVDHFIPTVAVIDGDRRSYAVSAAAIIAKVIRDRFMRQLDNLAAATGKKYSFALHKGYGTSLHQAELAQFGVSPWHRRSFDPVRRMIYTE